MTLCIYTLVQVEDRKKTFATSNIRTDYFRLLNQQHPRVRGVFMEHFKEENITNRIPVSPYLQQRCAVTDSILTVALPAFIAFYAILRVSSKVHQKP